MNSISALHAVLTPLALMNQVNANAVNPQHLPPEKPRQLSE